MDRIGEKITNTVIEIDAFRRDIHTWMNRSIGAIARDDIEADPIEG
jgi:hypothetical protein